MKIRMLIIIMHINYFKSILGCFNPCNFGSNMYKPKHWIKIVI